MSEGAADVQPGSAVPTISPFAGMTPNRAATKSTVADGSLRRDTGRVSHGLNRGLAATMPIVLASSMAITAVGLQPHPLVQRTRADSVHPNRAVAGSRITAPAAIVPVSAVSVDAPSASASAAAVPDTAIRATAVPPTYVVEGGDSLSDIALRFGLSTASVLALNGLSWKSLIFPGQVLRLTATKAVSPPVVTAHKPVATAPHPVSATTYRIVPGDTITSIARRFGVSVESILTANQLTASSIIYSGRTLVIHGSASVPAASSSHTEPAQVGGTVVPLSPSMAANARTIIAVGKSLGVPSYGIIIALATAAQESHLENLSYGDRDSVGLFQQRPSAGWGTVAQLTTPTYASELFFGGPKNPNKGRTRGLLDIPGWQQLTLTQAAQAVQVSGAPNAYAKWETSARAWFAQLG
jgi:LysM repeat protein